MHLICNHKRTNELDIFIQIVKTMKCHLIACVISTIE